MPVPSTPPSPPANEAPTGQVAILIPARYGSTRFPGKALADIHGKPMIYYTYQQAKAVPDVARVIVATDDARIQAAVEAFGGTAAMTADTHSNGTERIAEVARGLPADVDIIVNVQGDEPLIDPAAIAQAIQPLREDPTLEMATLKHRMDPEAARNPNVVKVVADKAGRALYFSRARIPYPRDETDYAVFQHVGLYAYRRTFLLRYVEMAPTPLERREGLEQLRVLENGGRIRVVETTYKCVGVDTPEELEEVKRLISPPAATG